MLKKYERVNNVSKESIGAMTKIGTKSISMIRQLAYVSKNAELQVMTCVSKLKRMKNLFWT